MMRLPVLLTILLFACSPVYAKAGYNQLVKEKHGVFISYEDLVELSKVEKPTGALLEKYNKQLNNPIIKQPVLKQDKFLYDLKLGKFFRVAQWNIERGFNADKIKKIFADRGKYVRGDKLSEELSVLSSADIVILNEVDYGIPRTEYKNIAEIISESLGYGYVFAPEFFEVDPYQLGIKKFTEDEKVFLEEYALKQIENIQKDKYLGLHGSAILSKYPILSANVIRLPNCYDWYVEEARKLSALEHVRRGAADKIFSAKVLTELRHGGRMAIIADLLLPNNERVTVIGTHLENRSLPECRANQFQYLLNRIITIRNPIIIGGDMNTTGTDSSPVSVKKEVLKRVKDPEFLAKQALISVTPVGFAENIILGIFNKLRQYKNPTKKDIPIILPNKEARLFEYLEEFTFTDNEVFDVRGVTEKSYSKAGYLSNSNERALKGYKETFELPRSLGIGKFKLDWFFVKPKGLTIPDNTNGSYAYAPHFGRTLKLANMAYMKKGEKISDHYPITVDIPVDDPKFLK